MSQWEFSPLLHETNSNNSIKPSCRQRKSPAHVEAREPGNKGREANQIIAAHQTDRYSIVVATVFAERQC